MSTLERAIEIALAAHAGQVDKAGAPYILHPLRVMLSLGTDEARIAGVLHDVVEDSPEWSLQRLRDEGFSQAVITALDAVTKRDDEQGDENYMRFIERAGSDATGRVVKLADLKDNMDLSRIANPTEMDHRRVAKYRAAYGLLLARG